MEPMDETKNHNLDLINLAIRKLLEDRRAASVGRDAVLLDDSLRDDDIDRRLLYQLLSQVRPSLRSLFWYFVPITNDKLPTGGILEIEHVGRRARSALRDCQGCHRGNQGNRGNARNNDVARIATDEIAKELRHVKRQNTITHWLLSAVVVVTVAWQLSEVTLILKVKESLRHPFRLVRKLVSGFFRGKARDTEGDADNDKPLTMEEDKNGVLPAIPLIKMPELPMIDLTNFPSNDDDSD